MGVEKSFFFLFSDHKRLFSTLRTICPLDMLVNVVLLGQDAAFPTAVLRAHHELVSQKEPWECWE